MQDNTNARLGVVCNKVTPDVRRESYEGREYLVFPAVALRPMVLKGELMPAEEIATFHGAWDGRPVTLFHAHDADGNPVSVNEPGIWEEQRVGWLFNTKVNEAGALVPEVWLDIEKAKAAGDPGAQVLNAVQNGGQLDVSTAYWRQREPGSGVFNGKEYQGVSRYLRPDHLALLPGGIGECSWADGCGAPRLNQSDGKEPHMNAQTALTALGILRQTGEALLSIVNQYQEDSMTKEEKVAALLAKESNPFDQEELQAMPDSALDKLLGAAPGAAPVVEPEPAAAPQAEPEPIADVAPTADPEPAAEPEPTVEPEPVAEPEPAAAPEAQAAVQLPQILLDLAAALEQRGGIEAVLGSAEKLAAQEADQKAAVVERLAGNSRCAFSKEELEAMDLCVLGKLERSLAPSNYGGRGLQTPSENGGAKTLDMPSPWEQ
jgi:hypothetical protein